MTETVLIGGFLVFVLLVFIYRRGNRMPAEVTAIHRELVERLSEDELRVAYNEAVTGIAWAADFSWSGGRIAKEVEIATSLYVQLQRELGMPIARRDKVKRRNKLLKLGRDALRNSNNGKRHSLLSGQDLKVEQDFDDLPDRSQLDEVTFQLERA